MNLLENTDGYMVAKMTEKEKAIFKQGIAVGYKKAMQKVKQAYIDGQTAGIQCGIDSQNYKQIDKWLASDLDKLDNLFKK